MPTWVRVRDTKTNHEYDVDERSVPALPDGVEVVKGAEKHSGPGAHPRPATYGEQTSSRTAAESTKEKTR